MLHLKGGVDLKKNNLVLILTILEFVLFGYYFFYLIRELRSFLYLSIFAIPLVLLTFSYLYRKKIGIYVLDILVSIAIFNIFLLDDTVYYFKSNIYKINGATFLYYIPLILLIYILFNKENNFRIRIYYVIFSIVLLLEFVFGVTPKMSQLFPSTIASDVFISSILNFAFFYTIIKSFEANEKALKQNQSNIESLIENTDDMIWSVDKDFKLVSYNSNFKFKFFDLDNNFRKEWYDDFLVGEKLLWESFYFKCFSGNRYGHVVKVLENSGTPSYYQLTFNPMLLNISEITGVTIFARNITLQKKLELEIISTRDFFEMLFENMPVNVSVFNKDLKYIYTNPSSIPDSENRKIAIGLNDLEYADKTGFNKELSLMRYNINAMVLKSKNPFEFIETIDIGINEKQYYLRSYIPILQEDVLKYILCFGTDITKLKNIENELTKVTKEKESALQVKQEFLSLMSHEIRTPISAIVSLSELILKDRDNIDVNTKLNMLKMSNEQIQILVKDLLDYTKIESGKIELENKIIHLKELFNYQIELFKSEKNNKLIGTYDERIPENIWGDIYRLQQIITNLINNADKFTYEGKIELHIRLKQKVNDICILHFEVKDSGIGIEKDKMEHIFEPFTQAETSTTRKYGGTGLGLSIVKKLIELHHSEIQLQSRIGEGTTFRFEINFRIADYDNTDTTRFLNGKNYSKLIKALVVDDNPINIFIIRKYLDKKGILMEAAENGKIAIEKHLNSQYDFILMDVNMPIMNGIEASKKIRNIDDPVKASIPIIAFTADIHPSTHHKIIEAGMNSYILKPVDEDQLFLLIDKTLQTID